MFTFHETDDALQVFRGDRAVAVVDCAVVLQTIDPKLKDPVVNTKKVLPRDQWRVHFCGVKLTLPELESLVEELAAAEFAG